jgi:hypothetical protein
MKVAIINITGGGMSGGYRKYLQNLIPRLASHVHVESMLCASPASLNVQDWIDSFPDVKIVNCQPFHFLHYNIDHELNLELERFSPDVIFLPLERYLRFKKIPTVNMVRNMGPMVAIDGNPFYEKIRNKVQMILARNA